MAGKKYFFKGWYSYVACCVHAKAEDIEKMVDDALEITYNTFIKHVHLRDLNEQFGYGGDGIHLCNDWHVSYYRSKYKGRKCYFMKHSGIEYIFC